MRQIRLYTQFQGKRNCFVQVKTWNSKSNNSKSRDVRHFWTAYSFFSSDSEKESTLKKFWFPKLNFFQWQFQVAITPRNRVRCLEDLYIRDPLVIRSLNFLFFFTLTLFIKNYFWKGRALQSLSACKRI